MYVSSAEDALRIDRAARELTVKVLLPYYTLALRAKESVGEIRLGGLESYEIRNNPDLSAAFDDHGDEQGP